MILGLVENGAVLDRRRHARFFSHYSKNKDDFDNHQILLKDRNKNIKGVLNSIIQMKKKTQIDVDNIEDKINKINFGFNDIKSSFISKRTSTYSS